MMNKRALLAGLILIAFSAFAHTALAQREAGHVDVVTVHGVIDAITAQYIGRGIDTAIDDGAECLIIQLDTPGGLESSMRAIVRRMLTSLVPVVVYVSPTGARAGSAGVFITVAAHIAAMAPGTNIGAAHPVGSEGDLPPTVAEKATNDAVAFIRNVAESRGHNPDWAEDAVRKSVSITEKEALEKKVIDLIANDLRDLLDSIDGRKVELTGRTVTLKTKGASIRRLDMNLQENLLHALVDPTIAYLLLTIGIWALIAEFNNPGAILPGVTGAICLLLAFIAFESLPLNWGGVALIILAVVLFIIDIKAPTHGVLTAGGIIAFILGSLILFSPFTPQPPTMPRGGFTVPWPWIATMTIFTVLVFVFAIGAGIRAQRLRPTGGIEDVIQAQGIATSDLTPYGTVQVKSELWSAIAVGEHIRKGEAVRVVGAEGVRLKVDKA